MNRLVKIASHLYPVEGIEWVNFTANINGENGVEVKLIGIDCTFRYVGQLASQAYDILDPLHVHIGNDCILPHRIEWVDFEANFGGQTGVEVRVAGEQNENGEPLTRQYTGAAASEAYDALTALVETAQAAGN